MSIAVLKENGLLVVDNVLPAETFRLLGRDVSQGEFRLVHAQKWDKAWRVWDGFPLRGESVYFDPNRVFGWKGAAYPTATSVDPLIEAIRMTSAASPEVAGKEGIDWIALYLSPWLYPVGSALSLHRDGGRYSGSFTYFAHPRWNVEWGGELLVSRPSSSRSLPSPERIVGGPGENWAAADGDGDSHGDSHNDGDTDDPGIATCILPRPNRLVLIGPDRAHRIARVDGNAGARARASIAGFFLRPR